MKIIGTKPKGSLLKWFLTCLLALAVFLGWFGIAYAYTPLKSNTPISDTSGTAYYDVYFNGSTFSRIGESFSFASDTYVGDVQIMGYRSGGHNLTLTVGPTPYGSSGGKYVYSTNCSTDVPAPGAASGYITWHLDFTFTGGTTYYMWVNFGGSTTTHYYIGEDDGANTYADGHAITGQSSPSEWVDHDIYFKMWSGSAGPLTPTVTTGASTFNGYDSTGGALNYTINGTIVDDGGATITMAYLWERDYTIGGAWLGWPAYTSLSTGDDWSVLLTNLTAGHIIQYYAVATNSAGLTGSGNTANFTVSDVNMPPVVQITPWNNTVSASALNAHLTGTIVYDGNDSGNVNGNLYYHATDNSTWINTGNITGLSTGDNITADISGLSLSKNYEYYITATNSYGSSNSTIGSFSIPVVTTPHAITGNVTNLTSTSATIDGTVTDLGNDDSLTVYFVVRQHNSTSWTYTQSQQVTSTPTTITVNLTGLSPNTWYDYAIDADAQRAGSGVNGYQGAVKTFNTYATTTVPSVLTTTAVYSGHDTFVNLGGTVSFDGGQSVQGWVQYREYGVGASWIGTYSSYNMSTGGNWTAQVSLTPNTWYEYQACGKNNSGQSCDNNIKKFMLTDNNTIDNGSNSNNTQTDTITTFSDIVNNAKESLHLTGEFGTWAFMFLILIILSMFFGALAVYLREQKTAMIIICIIWGLASISVVGGFIFTGQLGIMPIVITSGVFVLLIMLLIGLIGKGSTN